MIVGLMGRAGVGKTHVQLLVAPLFSNCLDLDQLGHQCLKDPSVETCLVDCFGESILENESVSRQHLREKAFVSNETISQLNQCVHPVMQAHVEDWVQSTKKGLIVGALIYEIGIAQMCDVIVTIDASDESILKRSANRKDILNYQKSRQWYIDHSDIHIHNTWDETFDLNCQTTFNQIVLNLE